MASNNERREVAAAMREVSSRGIKNLTLGEILNSILTGGAPVPTTEMAILAHLADLIDPTCEVVGDNTYTSDYDFRCKTCGEHFSAASTPRYCPGCGRRIDYGDR